MKRAVIISLSIVLILYMIYLWKYLLVEEILGLYLIPILTTTILGGLCFLLIRIFKPIRFQKLFSILLLVACIAQVVILLMIFRINPSQSFTKEQIISDIDYAVNMLEEVHPDPYSIISKEDFYLKVDFIKQTLSETVSEKEAHRTISKIYALIEDGHTGSSPLLKLPRLKFLPYKFKIMNERIYVVRTFGYRNVIPVNSEIITINGMTSQQYIQEASQLFGWESLSWRNSRLQLPFMFDLWDDCRNYKIIFKTPEGKTKTIRTSGGLFSLLDMGRSELNQTAGNSYYQYKSLSDSIGFIEFNSFSDLEKFRIFLDTTFTTIQNENVKHLIIDIRKNGGGNSSLGDEIMQYISKTDFRQFDISHIKISSELLNAKRFEWLDSVERKAGTVLIYTSPLIELRENPLRFTGKTYLLVGGNTFSSASAFTSAFQCFEVGTVIGSETGGVTVAFGDMYGYKLPETKLDMGISHKKFFQACGVDNRRGVIPDYIVENSIEDEANSFDRVLEFTLDLIKK